MINKNKIKALEETIKLANTPDKKIDKMNYKEKQKVYKAKSSLCKLVWNSNKHGTYRNFDKEKK